MAQEFVYKFKKRDLHSMYLLTEETVTPLVDNTVRVTSAAAVITTVRSYNYFVCSQKYS